MKQIDQTNNSFTKLLFSCAGRIGRVELLLGLVVQLFLAGVVSVYAYGVFAYFIETPAQVESILQGSAYDAYLAVAVVSAALVATVHITMNLTIKRLRDLNWPTDLMVINYIPKFFISTIFTILLLLVPGKQTDQNEQQVYA